MDDAMISPERGCDPDAVPTDCGSSLALPYFVTFMIGGSFVFLNIVVCPSLHFSVSSGSYSEQPDPNQATLILIRVSVSSGSFSEQPREQPRGHGPHGCVSIRSRVCAIVCADRRAGIRRG